jgi:hypothetical protein
VTGDDKNKPKVRTLLELPYPDNAAPPELSVAIVSLAELCQLGMPDPAAIREAIKSAAFGDAPQGKAEELGGFLALDNKVFSFPVRNLRHKLYGRDRNEVPVRLLVTEGESAEGPVIFVSTLFNGAIEADVVKAATHVADKQPLTGATAANSNGAQLRRVFWDVEGAAGVRGLMISGPENVEDDIIMRAITAFNLVRRK